MWHALSFYRACAFRLCFHFVTHHFARHAFISGRSDKMMGHKMMRVRARHIETACSASIDDSPNGIAFHRVGNAPRVERREFPFRCTTRAALPTR